MDALSIQQPWAWAILNCGKDVENRTWPTRLRGRIQIHAGKKVDKQGVEWLREVGYTVPHDLPTGAFLGEVTIIDCVEIDDERAENDIWAFGPYCFTLSDPAEYPEPIPGRGQLGFWQSDNAGSNIE